jgi:NAD(P)-dependent dehydrogenase (short-subunit alcohol dehydrogenase family)
VIPALEGKVAVVTGGASGIGAACAALLRTSGAAVHVADLAGDRRSTSPSAAISTRWPHGSTGWTSSSTPPAC